jgi:hypothetical protein
MPKSSPKSNAAKTTAFVKKANGGVEGEKSAFDIDQEAWRAVMLFDLNKNLKADIDLVREGKASGEILQKYFPDYAAYDLDRMFGQTDTTGQKNPEVVNPASKREEVERIIDFADALNREEVLNLQEGRGYFPEQADNRREELGFYKDGGDVSNEDYIQQMMVGTLPADQGPSVVDVKASEALRALGEGTRGMLGLDPLNPNSEAYRTGQAFSNMPGVGVAAGAVKSAGKIPGEIKGLGERAAEAMLKLDKTARDRAIIEAAEASKRGFLNPSVEKDVWYHGTTADIDAFRPGERGAVFLTKDPQFASDYAPTSRLPSGEVAGTPNVMPVRVQIRNPFDYENPEHVKAVLDAYKKPKTVDLGKVKDNLELGNWNYIEDKNIQQAMKDLGFDGFYIKEQGLKNLGVFDPKKIKSAIGMQGGYDPSVPVLTKAHGGEVLHFIKKSSKRR